MPHWPLTKLELECYPTVSEHVARPWDAADEYLLNNLSHDYTSLVINDRHGALACALGRQQSWIDSACAIRAIKTNLKHNRLCENGVEIIENELEISPDCKQVVIKIPKNLEQLKFWLFHCATRLSDSTEYWLAGMAKHIPVSWLNWLEDNSETYEQFRIEKKARLIKLTRPKCPTPKKVGYQHSGLELRAIAGVFGRQKLDIGSRVLLPHLERIKTGKICDLGCGNGLLALTIKQRLPEAEVYATDDSLVAVRSTRENADNNGLSIHAVHSDCLQNINSQMNWIVCNPPYHDGHKELTTIASNMFRQSAQKLTRDGHLLVVANRHLPYQKDLQHLFRNVELLSKDPKFNVFLCSGSKHPR